MAMATKQSFVDTQIGANTFYILSTSGRISSVKRYVILMKNLGLDIAYLPISNSDVPNGAIDPERFVMALKGLNSVGGAISRDIKHSVMAHLDEIDPLAKAVDSVNTVLREGNRLIGYNTDALGFELAIKKGISESGVDVKCAVVYGYGGVSSVVFHVLKSLGIRVCVTGRRPTEAAKRATEYDVEVFDPSIHSPSLFVNAAPVTSRPLVEAPNLLAALEGCKVAFDHEMPGEFLKAYCTDHGLFHIPGVEMYYPQMEAQWKILLRSHLSEDALAELPRRLREADTESKL